MFLGKMGGGENNMTGHPIVNELDNFATVQSVRGHQLDFEVHIYLNTSLFTLLSTTLFTLKFQKVNSLVYKIICVYFSYNVALYFHLKK